MDIKLRIANESDLEWINEKYREIDLKNSELGGIYVLEDFRGKGIASKIVSQLVSLSKKYKYVYCIPFEHLERFYKNFGFQNVNDTENVPDKIIKKHRWCNEYYEEKTLLLVKKTP